MARSLYMPDMTNLEVREYLEEGGRTVIVPVGSTEDHGDHGPLWTDVYIPLEVAKRAAPEVGAIVGPPNDAYLSPISESAIDHDVLAGGVHQRLGEPCGGQLVLTIEVPRMVALMFA